jgi:hypothetical protein
VQENSVVLHEIVLVPTYIYECSVLLMCASVLSPLLCSRFSFVFLVLLALLGPSVPPAPSSDAIVFLQLGPMRHPEIIEPRPPLPSRLRLSTRTRAALAGHCLGRAADGPGEFVCLGRITVRAKDVWLRAILDLVR